MSYPQKPQQKTALVVSPAKPITQENAHLVLTNIHEFFPPERFNTIKPVQQLLPSTLQGMKPDIKLLNLKDHTYNQQGKKALTKTGIQMLADAYEVNIRLTEHEFVRGEYVKYSFTASMIRNGVTLMQAPGSQYIDVETEAELLRMDYEDKMLASAEQHKRLLAENKGGIPGYQEGHIYQWNKYKQVFEDKGHWERVSKKEILRMKKNMLRMCESKAMLAAMRNILGIQQAYSENDMEKPFVVFRLEPDYSNMSQEQLMAMREQAANASQLLSGQPVQAPDRGIDYASRSVSTGEIHYPVESAEAENWDDDNTFDAEFIDDEGAEYEYTEAPQTAEPLDNGPIHAQYETLHAPTGNNTTPEQGAGSTDAKSVRQEIPANIPENYHTNSEHGHPTQPSGQAALRSSDGNGAITQQSPVGDGPVREGGSVSAEGPHIPPPQCGSCAKRITASIVKYCTDKGISPALCMGCQPKG